MKGPTARQTECWEALQRHGGKGTFGAAAKACRELGITSGAFAGAITGYEKNVARAGAEEPRRFSARERIELIPERLDAIERHVESVLASLAALGVQVDRLGRDIDRWTHRQPIYVEMRPSHQRIADGGEGGHKEGRRLRRSVEAASEDVA